MMGFRTGITTPQQAGVLTTAVGQPMASTLSHTEGG